MDWPVILVGTLLLVTPPGEEPISLALAQQQCRIEVADEEWLTSEIIGAARQRCEDVTGRQMVEATYDLLLDTWPICDGFIDVPRPPLRSVTSIKYYDTAGVLQTWASTNYVTDASTTPQPRAARGRIALADGASWPTLARRINAVQVRFVAGYAVAAVPKPLVQGQLLCLGAWYARREDEVISTIVQEAPLSARMLWKPYIVRPITRQ